MGPVLVVVADKLAEDRRQVLLVQHDDVVEAFSTEGPDHSLHDCVRPRCPNGGSDAVDTDPEGTPAEVTTVDGISIVEQMARLLCPRRRLDELAPNPGSGRVGVTLTCTNSRRRWAMNTKT